MISESKIYDRFLIGNFSIDAFCSPYRSARYSRDKGITRFISEDIPSNPLTIENKLIEGLYVEINFRNDK